MRHCPYCKCPRPVILVDEAGEYYIVCQICGSSWLVQVKELEDDRD